MGVRKFVCATWTRLSVGNVNYQFQITTRKSSWAVLSVCNSPFSFTPTIRLLLLVQNRWQSSHCYVCSRVVLYCILALDTRVIYT